MLDKPDERGPLCRRFYPPDANPEIDEILSENSRRRAALEPDFDPISGLGSIGSRVHVRFPDLAPSDVWLPEPMLDDPLMRRIVTGRDGDVCVCRPCSGFREDIERLRCRHDFAYWCACYIFIKRKGGGDDVNFRLTRPQRRFVERLEADRLRRRPIRIVLLKARQWGGSTTSQIYMAWLQLVHRTGLNSLIIAHQGSATDEIKDMFDRAIRRYPLELLYEPGEEFKPNEKKIVTVGRSGCTFRVPQRNCKVKIGSAERPDSCRGGDYNLVHLSEVGIWKTTLGKKPEDIVRAACSGVMYVPDTMIVYESTANGVGNFFHREYIDARDNPRSQFRAMFVPWYDIEQNRLPFLPEGEASDPDDTRLTEREFARRLYEYRNQAVAPSNREEPGRYLWWLWERGATLEGINWYVTERAKHTQHGSMAAECPSDDTEAFVNSGAAVFDKYKVEALRPACRPPAYTGEIEGYTDSGDDTLRDLRFCHDPQGFLQVWSLPYSRVSSVECREKYSPPSLKHRNIPSLDSRHSSLDSQNIPSLDSRHSSLNPLDSRHSSLDNQYLAVVDIGGRSYKSDWSVIVVFDRKPMISGGVPEVVAQWYGHCDIDLLAWKAARIAAFYDNALLVIESNTLETHDAERMVDGDQSHFILNQIRRVYDNLYARRRSDEDIRLGRPVRYGFHTNVATKPMIISTLVKMVREGLYTERDERCLDEYLVYERKPNGSYGAVTGAHDDLLMTRAIGLHICYYDMTPPRLLSDTSPLRPRLPLSEATI